MSYELDCRGMTCPEPVLNVRKAIETQSPADITVLVDNDAARQNISRFLEHQQYQVTSDSDGSGFRVFGSRSGTAVPPASSSPAPSVQATGNSVKKIMVLVTSNHMGHGDDSLGDMLQFNFLKTLKEMGPELWRVVFVNGGVDFTADGSEAVPVLQELVDNGVQVLACGACLAYFHLLDKMQVGEVTNMLEIITGMKLADSVITV